MSALSGAGAVKAAPRTSGENSSPIQHPPKRRGSVSARFDHKVIPYLLISPFFILFAVFGMFPLLYNGWVAFQNWILSKPSLNGFCGFGNFTKLFQDPNFWNALGNTFGIFVLSTVPQLVFALILAALLNRRLRSQNFFRVGILLPYVTPIAASTLVFAQVFARDTGIANWFLGWAFHVETTASQNTFAGIDWRADKWSSWLAIAIIVNWRWIGYNALLYLSAMQSIPKDVYEAAALDGAGPWKQLWRITLPMIRPMVIFTVVLSTIGGLQLFAEPLLFDTQPAAATGGSDRQFQTVAMLIYETAWKKFNLGYAAAMSWTLFLIILVLAGINALLTNRLGGKR